MNNKKRMVEVFFLNKKTIELEEGQKTFTAMSIPDGAMESKEALMKAVYLNSIRTEEYEVAELTLPNTVKGKGNIKIRIAEARSLSEKTPFIKPLMEKIESESSDKELKELKDKVRILSDNNLKLIKDYKEIAELYDSSKNISFEKRKKISDLEMSLKKEREDNQKNINKFLDLKKEISEASFFSRIKYALGVIEFG